MAGAWSNPRVRQQVRDAEGVLLAQARAVAPDDAATVLAHWVRLADVDGARRHDQVCHERRDVSIRDAYGGAGKMIDGRLGAEQGAAVAGVFDRFCDAERRADWDTARAAHGDATTAEHLARTESQRRADALAAMADAAASAHPEARRPEPLVNIVVDEDTLTEHLDRATSGRCDRFRPRPGAVCRLADGTPLDPAAAVTAALQGAVRRVVVDSAGVIVAAGTERRLFTGPIRDLLLTQVPECTWPGCHVRVRHCQIDHAHEWHQGGRTDPANANLLCGRHNRWKTNHGYRVHRDPNGVWHTYRPDGTEVGEVGRPPPGG